MDKELFAAIATALAFIAFLPYIRSTLKGHTKPHVFSWVIWGIATFTVFFAQMAAGAGVGAIPMGFSATVTCFIALLAFLKRSDISITRFDWLCFITAISAIPLWVITSEPLWSVILLTVIDLTAYLPSIRKGYHSPQDENVTLFSIMTVRNGFAIAALEHYSATTMLFPLVTGLANIILILVVLARRQRVSKPL